MRLADDGPLVAEDATMGAGGVGEEDRYDERATVHEPDPGEYMVLIENVDACARIPASCIPAGRHCGLN